MASYVGKVQIGSDDPILIGSTLYGLCYSAASSAIKDITASTRGNDNLITGDYVNTSYDTLIRGTTIHIKFIEGNSAASNVSLKVGTQTSAQEVIGNFVCSAGSVISFTLDENYKWVVNDNIDNNTTYTFSEGSTTGAFNVSVDGGTATAVNIHGLGTAAYKAASTTINSSSTDDQLPGAATIYQYVQDQTGGLSGLTGAMHFRGIATTAVTDGGTEDPTISTYDFGTNGANAVGGDVVLWDQKEYVWTGSAWELLGDEGSYALRTSTASVVGSVTFTANTTPSLTTAAVTASKVTITTGTTAAATLNTTAVSIPNVTQAGTPTTASVSGGILIITSGTATVLGTDISVTAVQSFTASVPDVITATNVIVNSVTAWDAGSAASLTATAQTAVVP